MNVVVYLSLGSNMGDREGNIYKAVDRLSELFGKKPLAVSDLIETKSWGFDAPDFINAAVAFEMEDPDGFEILKVCKQIETEMGRVENVVFDSNGNRVYHSRIIDIDILLIGDQKIDTDVLKVPHPLMYQREFVMVPLRQINEKLNN